MSIRSQRDGFVYVFYQGTQPGSFYLLFPNQLDSNNAITANQELQAAASGLERDGARPARHRSCDGNGHARPRATSRQLALPAEYVSRSGPFEKIRPTVQAAAHISQLATLSAAAGQASCRNDGGKRDLGVARECSNVFGASLLSVEETD